jgi:hypothetical protein
MQASILLDFGALKTKVHNPNEKLSQLCKRLSRFVIKIFKIQRNSIICI